MFYAWLVWSRVRVVLALRLRTAQEFSLQQMWRWAGLRAPRLMHRQLSQRQLRGDLVAAAGHHDGYLLADGAAARALSAARQVGDLLAVDRHDHVADLEPGLRGGAARKKLTDADAGWLAGLVGQADRADAKSRPMGIDDMTAVRDQLGGNVLDGGNYSAGFGAVPLEGEGRR